MQDNTNQSAFDMLLEQATPKLQQAAAPEAVNPIFEQPEFKEAMAHPRRTEQEEGRRTIGRKIKTGVAALTGKIGDIQSSIEDLISLPSGKTAEQNRELLKQYGLEPQGGRFPNTQEMKEGIEKHFPSLKAESEDERKQEEGEEFFVNLMGGGAGRSLVNRLARAGIGSYAAMKGADALKDAGVGATGQTIGKILLSIASQTGRTGGLDPRNMTRAQRIAYAAAQRAGLTEEETTPLLQSGRKARRLGGSTSESEANRMALEGAERGTGRFLNQLEARGSNIPLPRNEVNNLERIAINMRDRLLSAYGEEPEARRVANYLDTIIRDLGTGPHNAQRLIQTYRAINRQFRRNIPHLMNTLQPYNNRITRVLMRVDPQLGRDFRLGNTLVRNRHEFINNVGWENLERSWAHGTAAQNLLASVISGGVAAATGHGAAASAVAGAGASAGWHWVANQLLTNPRWQGVQHTTLRALRDDMPKLAHSTIKTIKEKVKKENPDAYKNIEWFE